MTNTSHGRDQAKAQLESIIELMDKYNSPAYSEDENIIEEIYDFPLSICVRTDWIDLGNSESTDNTYAEYQILLCTGGPAVKIEGTLDEGSPDDADLYYCDWGTSWTPYPLDLEGRKLLLQFAQTLVAI